MAANHKQAELSRSTVVLSQIGICPPWVKEEDHRLGDRVVDGFMNSEVKDYVTAFPFNLKDKDEEKLREVYYEHNKKELSKKQLINGLIRKGYTEKEDEKLIEKYTTIEIKEDDQKDWYEPEKLFKKPKYKPLRHHKKKRITDRRNGDITKDTIDYEIMQIEEWELREYEDLNRLRNWKAHIYGTKKVPFKTIRKILRQAEKQGRKTLTRNELTQKIIEECNATEEEAKIAIYGARQIFKIRPLISPLRKIWNLEPFKGEVEYYWSGTTSGFPPFTLQDRVFNPIIKVLMEAEKQGIESLTREELLQRAFESFEEYRWSYRSIPLRKIEREFIERIIEDAEELLLITAQKYNGETKYKINHQILKQ